MGIEKRVINHVELSKQQAMNRNDNEYNYNNNVDSFNNEVLSENQGVDK